MQSLTEIACKTCGKIFFPKSERNKFCSRRCFKKDFYHRKKAEELSAQKFPEFVCPKCGQDIILGFDPTKDTMRWLHYSCNGCNTLMIEVTEAIVVQDASIG